MNFFCLCGCLSFKKLKDSLLCDAKVTQVQDYYAAHVDEAVGKTIKPSLTLYANMEKKVESAASGWPQERGDK